MLDLKKIEETFYRLIDSITKEELDDFYSKLEPALILPSIKCESVKIHDIMLVMIIVLKKKIIAKSVRKKNDR